MAPLTVRGISTDDLHTNVKKILLWLAGEGGKYDTKEPVMDPVGTKSMMRDLLSACPSVANLSMQKANSCTMSFSTIGKACVYISNGVTIPGKLYLEEKNSYEIVANREFSYSLLVNFILGVVFLSLAHPLSKSKLFQVVMIGTIHYL